jgi:putative transposase
MGTKSFIPLYIHKPVGASWEELNKALYRMRFQASGAANHCMTQWWLHEVGREAYHQEHGEWPDYKAYPEPNLYKEIVNLYPEIATQTASCIAQDTRKRWKTDRKNVFYFKTKSLSTFKKTYPIPIHNQQYRLYFNEGGQLMISVVLQSQKADGPVRFDLEIKTKKMSPSHRSVLKRIMSGEFKRGTMKIKEDKKKNLKKTKKANKKKKEDGKKDDDQKSLWVIRIAYTAPDEKSATVDPKRVMGLHLGFINPFYCAVSGSKDRFYSGDGKEIQQFRQQIRARRKSYQNQSAVSTRGGKGRVHILRPIQKLATAERNFRDTKYHQYTRKIIDFAIKCGCGIIQLENLDSLKEKKIGNWLLEDWAISDLQLKLAYKAQEKGIKLKFVEPQYTSQICSECGKIYEESRWPENNQFICLNCGFKCDADYNAARNLTDINLIEIIKKKEEGGDIGETPGKKKIKRLIKALQDEANKAEGII